ncbi:hypothetical protein [Roseburia inulinivorans]|nr:hypothetical protein [Roseburia inulinivorans]
MKNYSDMMPNGDMEYEFGDYGEYVQLLNKCINQKKDLYEILEE